jgi:hypothetical protein
VRGSRETLIAELKAFKVKQTATGHETFAGDRDHDDTVISLALACWYAEAGACLYPDTSQLQRGPRVIPGVRGEAARRNIFGMGAFRP